MVLFVKFRVIRGSFLPEREQHEFQIRTQTFRHLTVNSSTGKIKRDVL